MLREHTMSVLLEMMLIREVSRNITLVYEERLKQFMVDIDIETFKTMWELSSPNGEAPGCFKRLRQKEYHREATNLDTLSLMPNVSCL